MAIPPRSFAYDHRGCDIVFGRGCTDRLSTYLDARDPDRALIVCGSNVGANPEVMDPVRKGLGERLVGTFDETTPAKLAETAYDLIDTIHEIDADVLVGVGGGSSLDIARQASVFEADGRTLEDLEREANTGAIDRPTGDTERIPVFSVPTTLTGADVSGGGSIEVLDADESPTDQPINASDPNFVTADFVDPSLIATTPMGALMGSAMNGFNKGLETPYAVDGNPMNDAFAVHGLRYFGSGLRKLGRGVSPPGEDAYDEAALGSVLVQLDRKISIIHAFGQAFARRYPVQQGAAHAAVVPEVLRYLLDHIDANRRVLALGLGIDPTGRTDDEVAADIVSAVASIRDGLDVPAAASELPDADEEDIPALAAFVLEYSAMERLPDGIEPTQPDIEAVLRNVW